MRKLVPLIALALVGLALYLAYNSVRQAGPNLTQQSVITPVPTNWNPAPLGQTLQPPAPVPAPAPLYGGSRAFGGDWKS